MRKKLMMIVCACLMFLLNMTAQTGFAEDVRSKVTGQLIAPATKEVDDNVPGGLPETGEKTSFVYISGGITVMLFGSFLYYYRKKVEDKHD